MVRIPTNKPCIRRQLRTRIFRTMEQKWDAVVDRICHLNDKGVPVLVGTRSVLASEEVSRRLVERQRPHQVLNPTQTAPQPFTFTPPRPPPHLPLSTNM